MFCKSVNRPRNPVRCQNAYDSDEAKNHKCGSYEDMCHVGPLLCQKGEENMLRRQAHSNAVCLKLGKKIQVCGKNRTNGEQRKGHHQPYKDQLKARIDQKVRTTMESVETHSLDLSAKYFKLFSILYLLSDFVGS